MCIYNIHICIIIYIYNNIYIYIYVYNILYFANTRTVYTCLQLQDVAGYGIFDNQHHALGPQATANDQG